MNDTTPTTKTLDWQDVFYVLSNARRRHVIEYVRQHERTALDELATFIAGEASDEDTYKSVYVSLQQTHLPVLDERNIVHYEDESNTIRRGPRLDDVELYTHAGNRRRYINVLVFGLSLVSLVFLSAVLLGILGLDPTSAEFVSLGISSAIFLVVASNLFTGDDDYRRVQ